ncbi:phenazine biosynthesis protein PhzF family [Microbacterium hydrothermale]|nr:phenazine biosynthesis protein PhzF family [Microbacterium hydrothermale]
MARENPRARPTDSAAGLRGTRGHADGCRTGPPIPDWPPATGGDVHENRWMTETPGILHLLAFAAEPGGGNPAGVVLDATDLDDADMQRIATDLGHPETAFVGERDGRRVAVRYFSPGAEVPFCGHATIATAVALAEAEGLGPFTFDTAAGAIEVATDRDAEGHVTAGFTSVEPDTIELEPDVADRLLGILGLDRADLDDRMPLAQAFAGNLHPVVAIASRETFDSFTFDPAELRELMDERGWKGTVITAHVAGELVDGVVVEARNLFPVGDITEDPATGSAAASLGAYLRDRLGLPSPFAFTVRQGRHIGRPSVLEVEVPASGGIRVSGTAALQEG